MLKVKQIVALSGGVGNHPGAGVSSRVASEQGIVREHDGPRCHRPVLALSPVLARRPRIAVRAAGHRGRRPGEWGGARGVPRGRARGARGCRRRAARVSWARGGRDADTERHPETKKVFIALVILLPRSVHPAASRRIDVLGGLLVTAATGTLIWAIINAGERGVWQWGNGVAGLVAIALCAAFVVRQRTARAPLMDLRRGSRRRVRNCEHLPRVRGVDRSRGDVQRRSGQPRRRNP